MDQQSKVTEVAKQNYEESTPWPEHDLGTIKPMPQYRGKLSNGLQNTHLQVCKS